MVHISAGEYRVIAVSYPLSITLYFAMLSV